MEISIEKRKIVPEKLFLKFSILQTILHKSAKKFHFRVRIFDCLFDNIHFYCGPCMWSGIVQHCNRGRGRRKERQVNREGLTGILTGYHSFDLHDVTALICFDLPDVPLLLSFAGLEFCLLVAFI